jgi:hypothetical protein
MKLNFLAFGSLIMMKIVSYKIQMEFKNHECCRVFMISYIEIVIDSRERFEQFDMYAL